METCCRSRNAISAGALLAPCTGSFNSRARSAWFAVMFRINTRNSGPAAIGGTSVTIIVRRSRSESINSLAATIRARLIACLGGQALARAEQRHEGIFQRNLAGASEQFGAGAAGDHAPVPEDH